jgi:hypothetical protein
MSLPTWGEAFLIKLENTLYTGVHDEFPEEVEEKLQKEESHITDPESSSPTQTS